MLDFLTQSFVAGADLSLGSALISLGIAIILGIIISYTYMKTEENNGYSQSLMYTLIIIPTVVAIIIFLVGSNIARAFGLAGTFSLVRFRSATSNSKNIAYIFFGMAAGLACGAEAYLYALFFTLVLCILMYVLTKINFGKPKSTQKILKIIIPENLNYEGVFDEVLKKYTKKYNLLKVRTADLGSVYELVYSIAMSNKVEQKKFIDELRCRNGNLNITLVLNADKEEF